MAENHSITEERAKRLAARASKRGKDFRPPIVLDHPVTSLFELLNEMGDAFPNNAELDANDYPSRLNDEDVVRIAELYNVPPQYEVVCPSPGDRTCNWDPEDLFIYEDAFKSGLRFPLNDFIPRLLAEARINPCQLVPNAWRIIHVFMALCVQKGFPLSINLFRSIFVFKNSPECRKGWIHIGHRPGVPHTFFTESLPDSNHVWKWGFVILRWRGGNWGEIFRPRFATVNDPGRFDRLLTRAEHQQRDELISDKGRTHYRAIINENALRSAGLSFVSDSGNFLQLIWISSICSILVC